MSVRVCESAVCKYAFLVGFALLLPPGWHGRPSLRRLVVSVPCVFINYFSFPPMSIVYTSPPASIFVREIEEEEEREWLRMHWFHLEELKTGMCTQISISIERRNMGKGWRPKRGLFGRYGH